MKRCSKFQIMTIALFTGLFILTACSRRVTTTSTNTIQGIVWQWVSVTKQPLNETTTVSNPENYTIAFKTDGTFEGKADCNIISGTYSQTTGFTIKVETSTEAYCGDTSLDQQYLTLLGSVAAGGPDGAGSLALETAGGEQRMLFTNGGAASK
jgi:heat shock protein HslJ